MHCMESLPYFYEQAWDLWHNRRRLAFWYSTFERLWKRHSPRPMPKAVFVFLVCGKAKEKSRTFFTKNGSGDIIMLWKLQKLYRKIIAYLRWIINQNFPLNWKFWFRPMTRSDIHHFVLTILPELQLHFYYFIPKNHMVCSPAFCRHNWFYTISF